MIETFYVPTRGVDFLIATCVADSSVAVSACLRHGEEERALSLQQETITTDDRWFWRFIATNLGPNQAVNLFASQGPGNRRKLKVTTLPRPPGCHRLRFGIVADPHCTRDRASGVRLFAESFLLLERSLNQLAKLGAKFVMIPGDLTDEGSPDQIEECHRLLATSPVPVHLMIGNHDGDPARFLQAFDLGPGYYSFDHADLHFVCLRTHSARDLSAADQQWTWLKTDLAAHADRDTFVFSHYSLIRHPYLYRIEDSMREVENPEEICALLRSHTKVRAAFAGHKNIPSRTDDGHVTHLLCPQIVHYPCGFDVVDVYEGGLVRQIFEIDDLGLMWRSRQAHTDPEATQFRYGLEEGRNVVVLF